MGGVDTQRLLPLATADEVRRATRSLIDSMTADGGGYILAASHTIPPETPLENIFAMYQEAGISREEAFDRAAGIRQRRVGGAGAVESRKPRLWAGGIYASPRPPASTDRGQRLRRPGHAAVGAVTGQVDVLTNDGRPDQRHKSLTAGTFNIQSYSLTNVNSGDGSASGDISMAVPARPGSQVST